MSHLYRIVSTTLIALLFAACTSKDVKAPQKEEAYTSPEQAITFMTFNVENLFDTVDTKGKDDETFLPLSAKTSKAHKKECMAIKVNKWRDQCLEWDWSEKALKTKLKRLGEVISSAKDGKGPDILVLQEVENRDVLERLRKEHLSDLGYKPAILIEGHDIRGIDVAILSRLEVVGKPVLLPIPFKKIEKRRKQDTRGILRADFKLPDDNILTAFSVHFPAPFHPAHLRKEALDYLTRLQVQLPEGRMAIAGGDFNIPSEEDKKEGMLDKHAEKHWLVAHRIGCKDCKGTTYYPPKDSWSFLDMILLSENLSPERSGEKAAPWKVIPSSVRIYNDHPEQKTKEGYPKDFSLPEITGVSDHWPLAVDIVPR